MKKLILASLLLFLLANLLSAQEVVLQKGKYVLRESKKAYTGVFREYNTERKLISATGIKDGLLDGTTTIYYLSGAKKEVRAYTDGQKNGIWITWNEEGVKTAEASFKNGKKDGPWYVWDDKGIKRYEMFYVNGGKSGTWVIRDEKGSEISREEFK